MRNYFRGIGLLSIGCLLLNCGCGSETDSLVPVRGKVYYKGMPLSGGTIVFAPDAVRGGSGPVACGEIKPDGSYQLKTDDMPGAVPGWHRVTIVSVESDGSGASRSLLPAKYRDPDLSGLEGEVKPERGNDIDFHLD
jgi:hypothetical protein